MARKPAALAVTAGLVWSFGLSTMVDVPLLLGQSVETDATGPTATLHLVPAPSGNEARYRVREQLARVPLPNDAVGSTNSVAGSLVLDESGAVVSEQSKFVVDLTTLRSDRRRRDRYVRTRTLETDRFPTLELVPTKLTGLPFPLPESGEITFELLGNLTVRGITRPTTWQVTAQITDSGFVGTAATRFHFADFELTKPSVAVVLSVEDEIRLEYDFHLVLAPEGDS